jgi:hypothetical protein
MRFIHLLSPANWLKVALFSLVLACAAAWFLLSYRYTAVSNTGAALISALSSAPSAIPTQPTKSLASLDISQTYSIAPPGILDQHKIFAELIDYEDTYEEPEYFLPAAVTPIGLLDPTWNGVTR